MNKTALERKKALLDCLGNMRLEQAVTMMRDATIRLERSDFEVILAPMTKDLQRARRLDRLGEISRWVRRLHAIKGLRDYGPDPRRMIKLSDLAEGYQGKILLVHLAGGVVEKMICLRSGDDWHRSILANTREEIMDLGFDGCIVHELGGASVSFEPNGAIVIWGTSDDFGPCDKAAAAALIARAYPRRQIVVSD